MKKIILGIAAMAVLFTSNVFASVYTDYLDNPEKTLRELESANDKKMSDRITYLGSHQAYTQLFSSAGVSSSLELQLKSGTKLKLDTLSLIDSFDKYSKHLLTDYTEKDNMLTKYFLFNSRFLDSVPEREAVDEDNVSTIKLFNIHIALTDLKSYKETGMHNPLGGFSIIYKMIVRNNHSDLINGGHNADDILKFISYVSSNNYEKADEMLNESFGVSEEFAEFNRAYSKTLDK